MIKNLILIYTSYTLFHRYFATLRWLSLAHNEIYKEYINNVEYNWIENKIFSEKYEKLYIEGIIKLVGKKIYKKSNIIFCMDAPKEQVWRTELKCDYKGDRFDMSQKTNLLPTFKYTYNSKVKMYQFTSGTPTLISSQTMSTSSKNRAWCCRAAAQNF
jgi:hypothetical protein